MRQSHGITGDDMRTSIFAVLAIAAAHGGAWAGGIQAQCGPEQGKGYAAEQGIVPKGEGGWYEDQTRSGETVVRINTDTGDVNVRFKDSSGVWADVGDDGGTTTLWGVQGSPPSFMVVIGYAGTTVEVLTLAEITKTSGKLIHSVSRNLDTLTNSRVMIAACAMSQF